MKLRYIPLLSDLASARLRGIIPSRQLRKMGFEISVKHTEPADWAILSKHGWGDEWAEGCKVIFDVCDDHFSDEHADHYLKWCRQADKVTCNSKAMAEIIKARTGRDAIVIPDPYEAPETDPKCYAPVLWFGQAKNLTDLWPHLEGLPQLVICTDCDHPQILRWSPANIELAFRKCGLTVLPTGEKLGKSANRAIESIRRGVFPVCGHLPAYSDLGLGTDDIVGGVRDALDHPGHTIERVMDLQSAIRHPFAPETISRQWAECF